MIEFGTVKEVDATKATVLVEFQHLGTEATCTVIVPTTGSNAVFYLPAKDTQVVCWLESGKNLCLGAVFSEADPVPDGVDADTQIQQFGNSQIIFKKDSITFKIESITIEMNKDEITLNGAQKGSFLTDINALVSKLNTLESQLNNLKTVFTSWVPAPMDGGAVLKGLITTWATQTITPTQVSNLKDDKVKH